jgi:C-terminal processing protease CtpA/Prc
MSARPPIRTRLIEDKVLITEIYDPVLRQNGIEAGQEIIEIDGIPVKQYAEQRVKPYQSVSTKQMLDWFAYELGLLGGASKNPVKLTVKNADGKTFEKTLNRLTGAERAKLSKSPPPFEFKVLPGNIAYVALNTFGNDQAAEMFEKNFDEIAKSNALIIDVRENGGGNSLVGYRVLTYLTDKPFETWGGYMRLLNSTVRAWGQPQNLSGAEIGGEVLPNGKKLFAKPVIVLTSPRTASAAEDFTVAYSQMKRGLIIGEPTAGSTGQPLHFSLPGGGSARVTTMRLRFRDGREFIGKGVQPDRAVSPTVTDFRAGRDTVLESAIMELKK